MLTYGKLHIVPNWVLIILHWSKNIIDKAKNMSVPLLIKLTQEVCCNPASGVLVKEVVSWVTKCLQVVFLCVHSVPDSSYGGCWIAVLLIPKLINVAKSQITPNAFLSTISCRSLASLAIRLLLNGPFRKLVTRLHTVILYIQPTKHILFGLFGKLRIGLK